MRRSLFIVLVAGILCTAVTPASALHTIWHRSVWKAAHAVAVAPGGSVYVAAHRRVSIGIAAVLQKYSPSGDLLWRRRWLPDPHAATRGTVVGVAPDGTVVWGGDLQGQCEGGGWFLEWLSPAGTVLHRYVTPDWECGLAEQIRDIAVSGDLVAVAGYSHGCCGDPFADGWVRALGMDGKLRWEADIEPPAGSPKAWFDTATGVAMGGLGNIYVSGWAATEPIATEFGGKGTPILVKVTSGGGVSWSHRAPATAHEFVQPVAVAVRGDQVVLSAGVGGTTIRWGTRSTAAGWVGAFDTGGSLRWTARWDDEGAQAAIPAHVVIDAAGAIWVVGTRRDVGDHGYDAFVRRFGPSGGSLSGLRIDHPEQISGTGIALGGGGGAYVTTFVGYSIYDAHGGDLWKVVL